VILTLAVLWLLARLWPLLLLLIIAMLLAPPRTDVLPNPAPACGAEARSKAA